MQNKTKRASLIILLFLIIAGSIIYSGNWFIETTRQRMLHETEQNLRTSTTQQIALLTVWYGSLLNQVEGIVGADVLRLFASELESSHLSVEKIMSAISFDNRDTENTRDDPVEKKKIEDFIARMPGLQQFLNEFVKKNGFNAGYVFSKNSKLYLVAGERHTFDEKILDRLRRVPETGRPLVLPIRKMNRELVVDIAFPVFAPKYIDQREERVVGIFLATCSVQKVVSAIDQTDANGIFTSAVLEQGEDALSIIDPLAAGGGRTLPKDWEITTNEMPLLIRTAPTRYDKTASVYCLAVAAQELPWYVMQAITVSAAEDSYKRIRENVYIGCALAIALILILFVALWWWIVGRRERALAEQMRNLYLIASEQKQILDGVNTALSAGVVLNDLSGVLYYVNHKYAEMAHMAPEQMYGMKYSQLPYEMACSLATHTCALNEKPELCNYTETLPVGAESRQYLTACSPFIDENNCLVGMVSVYSDITELIQAQERAQRMVTQTVEVFVRAIEAVDPYLCGQSSSTARLAEILAKHLKRDDEETLATLRTAASLSQIGMIQLPSSLLLKTGVLTQEERAQMQKHVEYARTALEGVDFGLPVLEAITEMYERLDGSGYPKHLKEPEICFNARLLAVANTFCALMRPRSYRTAHTKESALRILEGTPHKYDLTVTAALREFLNTEDGDAFLRALVDRSVEPAMQKP